MIRLHFQVRQFHAEGPERLSRGTGRMIGIVPNTYPVEKAKADVGQLVGSGGGEGSFVEGADKAEGIARIRNEKRRWCQLGPQSRIRASQTGFGVLSARGSTDRPVCCSSSSSSCIVRRLMGLTRKSHSTTGTHTPAYRHPYIPAICGHYDDNTDRSVCCSSSASLRKLRRLMGLAMTMTLLSMAVNIAVLAIDALYLVIQPNIAGFQSTSNHTVLTFLLLSNITISEPAAVLWLSQLQILNTQHPAVQSSPHSGETSPCQAVLKEEELARMKRFKV